MKKKQLLVIVMLLALAVGGASIWAMNSNTSKPREPQTQEEALEQARNYKEPEGMACASVITPALHTETGAKYTFSSGCIPNGWARDSQ